MAKKLIKSKIVSDSEESSKGEKTNKKKHQCPKCGLQFLSLARHKKCIPVYAKTSKSDNFANNVNLYRALYIFIHERNISLTIALKAFEKVIQSEINQVVNQEVYTENLLAKYKEIKLKEIAHFNEHFIEYYNDQRDDDDETESVSIEDINANYEEKRTIVFNKIKQLRNLGSKEGKMCKSCYNTFKQLQGHLFYDASCKEFIHSIMNEKSYFKRRGLIFSQIKYVYRVKFRETKLSRLFRLIDSCYEQYANSKEEEFVKIKKILQLIGDRITKYDY